MSTHSHLSHGLRDQRRIDHLRGKVKPDSWGLPLDTTPRAQLHDTILWGIRAVMAPRTWDSTRVECPDDDDWIPTEDEIRERQMDDYLRIRKALRMAEIEFSVGYQLPSAMDLEEAPEAPSVEMMRGEGTELAETGMRAVKWNDIMMGEIPVPDYPVYRTTEEMLTYPRSAIPHWMPPDYVSLTANQAQTVYHTLSDRLPEIWSSHRPSGGDLYILPPHRWGDQTPLVTRVLDHRAVLPRKAVWAPNTRQLLSIAGTLGITGCYKDAGDGTLGQWASFEIGHPENFVAKVEMDEADIGMILRMTDPERTPAEPEPETEVWWADEEVEDV